MIQKINIKGGTEPGVSEVVIKVTGGITPLNIYEAPPGLEEAPGRIERLLQEVLKSLRATGHAHHKKKALGL